MIEIQKKKISRVLLSRLILILSLMILCLLSISVGVKEFSLWGVLTGSDYDTALAVISRIPRTMAILITGAGLSVSGIIMQTITGNKFVSPTTAGTMQWCRFGVVLAILFAGGQAVWLKTVLAFVVSLAGTLLFMVLLQRIKFKNNLIVPLIGMMLGNVVSSIATFFAYQYEIIQNMSSWLQGNFSLVVKGNYEILYFGLPCLIIAYLYANKFTIAGMGESFAISLGQNHKKITFIGLILVAVLSSLITVSIGSIPFVGLIIPNLVSMYRGDNLKGSLFDTAALGAVFVLVCDIIGRLIIAPYEINVSVIISVLGSIVFIIIIGRNKK